MVFGIVIVAVAVGLSGCTGEDDQTSGGFGDPADNEQDNDPDDNDPDDNDPQENQQDPDLDCEDIECGDDEICVDGQCIDADKQGVSCAAPQWYQIDGAGTHVLQADPSGSENLLNTGCSQDDLSPQAVFGIEVDQPMQLEATVTDSELADPLAVEVRAECDNPTLVQDCQVGAASWSAGTEFPYYIIVEASSGVEIAEFELEIEAAAEVCDSPGEFRCDGDDLVQCYADGTEERTFACPYGCEDGECIGDSCDNPFVADESMSVTVDMEPFNNTMNFQNSPQCSTGGSTGPITSGQDLVFELPGLSAGDEVTLTAPHSSMAIGIMDSCAGAPQCIAGDDLNGELEWTVQSGGDYYGVFNFFTANDDEQLEFSVDRP